MPRLFALLTTLLVLAAVPASASAADRAFSKRFGVNDLGDIGILGNTLMTCPSSCAAAGGVTGNLNNNDNTMVRVDVDGDAATFDSSTATLTMPAGAEVLWAGLYWGADTSAGSGGAGAPAPADNNKVAFGTPAASGYTQLTAAQLDFVGTRYQGFADVTAAVSAGGNGLYRVANVQAGTGADRYAGWGLVVAYHDDAGLPRNLTVFDGFKTVNGGNPNVAIPVSGFTTAPTGTVNSTLGAISYEGDLASTGDGMQLDAHGISDAANPGNNVFNSTVANRGTPVSTGRSPNQVNHFGFDADLFDASGLLGNSATSATINLSTGGETYFPGMLSFASELLAPRIRTTTTVTDLNGGSAEPGDVLEYVVSGTNSGNDTADGVSMDTLLPADLDWITGSLELTSGTGAGPYTDAAGDDRATWDALARKVTWRLGTGATPTTGGSVAAGASFSARFRVRIGVPANGAQLAGPATTSYTGNGTGDPYELTGTVTSGVAASVPAPSPAPRTSTGVGTAVQTADLHTPHLGSARLLDAGSLPVTSRTVSGEGTYTLDTATGVVSFAPILGFHGVATPVGYRVTDRDARSAASTYTPAVTLPAPPAAPSQASTGVATATQTVTLVPPAGGRARLLSGGAEVSTLTVPGEGTYRLDPATGAVTFAPVLGFQGLATPVSYRMVDAYSQSTDTTYTPTVTMPAPPVADDQSSTGVGTAPQQVPITIPAGGRVRLLSGGAEVTAVTVGGEGTYALDPATGEVAFTPVLGFSGTPTPVAFRVTNAYGQADEGVYTPAVTAPLAPTATEQGSVGAQTETQVRVISLPDGGRLTLLDASGVPVSEVRVAGQGVYRLDAVAGTITFTPEPGFSGTPAPVTYQVTDAYGHAVASRYQPIVVASEAASTGTAGPAAQPAPAAVPVADAVTPVSACISRRTMTVNWKVPARIRLRTVRVSLNGVRTATLAASVRQVTVDLTGRARERVVVRIRATTTAGSAVGTTRTYRTCTRRIVHAPLNTLRLLPAKR